MIADHILAAWDDYWLTIIAVAGIVWCVGLFLGLAMCRVSGSHSIAEESPVITPKPEFRPMYGFTLHTPSETFILRHDGSQKSVDVVEGELLGWVKDREVNFTLADAGVIHGLVLSEHRHRQHFAANGDELFRAAYEDSDTAEIETEPGDNWPPDYDLGGSE